MLSKSQPKYKSSTNTSDQNTYAQTTHSIAKACKYTVLSKLYQTTTKFALKYRIKPNFKTFYSNAYIFTSEIWLKKNVLAVLKIRSVNRLDRLTSWKS